MTKLNSRRALMASGAIAAFLKPVLAADAKFDPSIVLTDVNAKNFASKIPDIIKSVKEGTSKIIRNDLAKDAAPNPQDLQALLQALSGEGDAQDDDLTANPGKPANPDPTKINNPALDDDHPIHSFLAQKLSPEDHGKAKEIMKMPGGSNASPGAVDWKARADDARKQLGRDETDEEMTKREEKQAGEDAKKKLGRDETPEEMQKRASGEAQDRANRRAQDKAARDAAADAKRKEGKAMDEAINTAVSTAVSTERKNQQAITAALRDVRPHVGDLDLAFDSADQVYKKALEIKGVKDLDGVHPSAFKAILNAQPVPGAQPSRERPAMDEKVSTAQQDFTKKFGTLRVI